MLRLGALPAMLVDFAADRDRGRLKGRVVRAVLGGLDRAEVAALTADFLDRRLMGLVRPTALAAIEAHRSAGDRLVLLSASTDFYVRALGARLGFDDVICTEVRWNGDRLDGALLTANRRGREKTRCLDALRAENPGARIAAYANAASDLEHLAKADVARLVNPSRAARRGARRLGIPVVNWN